MTREEIMAMSEGHRLNANIEKHIFGNEVRWVKDVVRGDFPVVEDDGSIIPRYSTSISAAWEVVQKILSKGLSIQLDCECQDFAFWIIDGTKKMYEYGKTAPEAICKSALLAILPGEE